MGRQSVKKCPGPRLFVNACPPHISSIALPTVASLGRARVTTGLVVRTSGGGKPPVFFQCVFQEAWQV